MEMESSGRCTRGTFEDRRASEGDEQEVSAATMEVAPMVVGLEHANGSTAAGTVDPSSRPADAASPTGEPSSVPKAPAKPKGGKLRLRKRRRKVRLLYLMQAWSVSLVVHVAILSALAAATFTSSDTLKKIVQLDSALASHRDGEQEMLPIYADPDNIPRDKAVGDENADDPREPAMMVLNDERR